MTTFSEIEKVDELLELESVKDYFAAAHRADILPFLFRVRGEPYSLENYPQFREMYSAEYVPDTIFMCGRQIGKSMNLSRSEILDMLTIPHFQILFVAPLQSQTQRYSTLYLKEAIGSCSTACALQHVDAQENIQSDTPVISSVHHQTFSNGAGIQLTYAKTTSDRARGIYADRIDFDEIQDQLVDNIPVISESLTASSWGIRRFTGTAKTVDNTIEHLWQDSCQYEWVMQCSGCNHWNFPTMDGRVLDMIRPTGVHCIKCGKQLNVREGQFVPAYKDRVTDFRGYHIPQIVVPAIVENPEKWSALVRKTLRLPLPVIMQEVLGISCSLGARLITQADIDEVSVLPSMETLQKQQNRYALTVGGVDWGIAQHDSFTVHTIVGVKPDGKIDVLWARRFSGFDPDTTLRDIAQAHRFYNCHVTACDFGMGFDKNIMLGQRFGLPIVQIMYCRQNKLLGYNPIGGQPRWTVDRTTAMELLFLAIKYGRIFFPPQEEFKIFTDDLLSPYEEVTESVGMTSRHFLRNPNRPDDFCHALVFATLAAMKLVNSSIMDLVPGHAFDPDSVTAGGVPQLDHVDPNEIMAALSI